MCLSCHLQMVQRLIQQKNVEDSGSKRLPFRLKFGNFLRNLYGVERGALKELVAHDPKT